MNCDRAKLVKIFDYHFFYMCAYLHMRRLFLFSVTKIDTLHSKFREGEDLDEDIVAIFEISEMIEAQTVFHNVTKFLCRRPSRKHCHDPEILKTF